MSNNNIKSKSLKNKKFDIKESLSKKIIEEDTIKDTKNELLGGDEPDDDQFTEENENEDIDEETENIEPDLEKISEIDSVIEDAELFTDNELEADEEPITEEKDDIETFTEEKDDVPEEESKKNVDDDDELKESNTKNTIIDNEDCLYVDDTFFDEEQTDEKISQRVPDDERISLPILSKYEMVNIIATRAKQISLGAKVLLKNPGKLQAKELAELELKNKMTPLKIKRNLPNGRYEIWKISELKNIN